MKRMLAAASLMLVAAGGASWGAGEADSAEAIRPLLLGAELPSVTVHQGDGSPFDLQDVVDSGPAVIIVYRGGW